MLIIQQLVQQRQLQTELSILQTRRGGRDQATASANQPLVAGFADSSVDDGANQVNNAVPMLEDLDDRHRQLANHLHVTLRCIQGPEGEAARAAFGEVLEGIETALRGFRQQFSALLLERVWPDVVGRSELPSRCHAPPTTTPWEGEAFLDQVKAWREQIPKTSAWIREQLQTALTERLIVRHEIGRLAGVSTLTLKRILDGKLAEEFGKNPSERIYKSWRKALPKIASVVNRDPAAWVAWLDNVFGK